LRDMWRNVCILHEAHLGNGHILVFCQVWALACTITSLPKSGYFICLMYIWCLQLTDYK
jgi:hypothetical protein